MATMANNNKKPVTSQSLLFCTIIIILSIISNHSVLGQKIEIIDGHEIPPAFCKWDKNVIRKPDVCERFLTEDVIGEYILGAIQLQDPGTIDINFMMYEPSTNVEALVTALPTSTEIEAHKDEIEFYFKMYNLTLGILPKVTWRNSTLEIIHKFTAVNTEFKYIYHIDKEFFPKTQLSMPAYDLEIEVPTRTRSFKINNTYLDLSSWGLTRWSLSETPLVTWEAFVLADEAFSQNAEGIFKPAPQFFRRLHNPCALDMIAFYIMTINNGFYRLYINIPLFNMLEDKWINLTSAFCTDVNAADCAILERGSPLVLTNDHLIASTTKGLFISEKLSESDSRLSEPYDLKPLLMFKLIDPCENISDIVHCFDNGNTTSTASRVTLHYNPVCHHYQIPNFRDTVILVIEHSMIGNYTESSKAGTQLGPVKAYSILFSDAPYNKWEVLLKGASTYNRTIITSLHGIFYNHVLNHFDVIIFTRTHGGVNFVTRRVILNRPKSKFIFFSEISHIPQGGLQSFDFSNDFKFRAIQVMPGSMDLFIYGNHLWIAESSSFLVYQALAVVSPFTFIESCSFGHADRYYVCVNVGHSALLVGRVGSFYTPAEIYPHQLPEFLSFALNKNWLPISVLRNNETLNDVVGSGPFNNIIVHALQNIHFTISFGGRLLIWYMRDFRPTNIISSLNLSMLGPERNILTIRNITSSVRRKRINNNLTANAVNGLSRLEIDLPNQQYVTVAGDGPLVALPLDPMSCVLFQAVIPEEEEHARPYYIGRGHVGLNIKCLSEHFVKNGTRMDCELYIRHVKDLGVFLPGFNAAILAYVKDPIPMLPFHCSVDISYVFKDKKGNNLTQSNVVLIRMTNPNPGNPAASPDCWSGTSNDKTLRIGWTLFMPGHYSILLNGISNDWNQSKVVCGNSTCTALDCVCVDGLSIRPTVKQDSTLHLDPYRSVLIDMSTAVHKVAHDELRGGVSSLSNYSRSWELEYGECNFDIELSPNSVLKGSGGHVYLDLQDTLSFTYIITPKNAKAKVMMQRPLLSISNSNPRILHLDRNYNSRLKFQSLDVVVRPTGLGIGLASLVVRSIACSNHCYKPCSHSFIFHLMRKEGHGLIIHYPIIIPPSQILNPDPDGFVRDSTGHEVYMTLPVNYRPPSSRGIDVPLGRAIYHADPSKPKWQSGYAISNETGVFGKCRHSSDRQSCGCTFNDKLSDHPDFTDCKEVVFKLRRGREFKMSASYPPLMNASDQNLIFFLPRDQRSIIVEEINKRKEYTISSGTDGYLDVVNSDKELNLGLRYYDANEVIITCFATGLFHFRAALGAHDSFGEVAGYFMFFCEDPGLNDITKVLAFMLVVTVFLFFLLFIFVRVRRSLVNHIPLQGEPEKVKWE